MSGEWLTYAEAATRLGIKADSVKKRAARRHWPRTAGNDGKTRIQLPEDGPGPVRTDIPPDSPAMSVPDDTRERLAASEARAVVLAAQVEDLQRERDRLLTLLEAKPVSLFARLFGKA